MIVALLPRGGEKVPEGRMRGRSEVTSAVMHRAVPRLRDRARDLRKALTVSERRLWNWLRKRTFCGYKFRRQFPIDRFILDFYCPELRLAIEVDGHQHEQIHTFQYDDARTARLERLGIRVFRIPNELLAKDSWMVEEQLRWVLDQRAEEIKR